MRIGLFTNNYRPLINGLTTSVDTFAGAFRRAGHDVTIVAPRYGAGGTDGAHPIPRQVHRDAIGNGFGRNGGDLLCASLEGICNRRGPFGLHANDARESFNPTQGLQIFETLVDS